MTTTLELRSRQEEVEKLSADLKTKSDYDTWDKICAFLLDDGGAGEITERMGREQAELKRAVRQLEIARAQVESLLREYDQGEK